MTYSEPGCNLHKQQASVCAGTPHAQVELHICVPAGHSHSLPPPGQAAKVGTAVLVHKIVVRFSMCIQTNLLAFVFKGILMQKKESSFHLLNMVSCPRTLSVVSGGSCLVYLICSLFIDRQLK
uniref:Uncharacterized protein n=1 Tax=Micrurus lemniscatus lemniscatus TaxID=129467 RepID=A0A2D4ILZ9_MICLE